MGYDEDEEEFVSTADADDYEDDEDDEDDDDEDGVAQAAATQHNLLMMQQQQEKFDEAMRIQMSMKMGNAGQEDFMGDGQGFNALRQKNSGADGENQQLSQEEQFLLDKKRFAEQMKA